MMYSNVNAPHTMAANVTAPLTMDANVSAPLTMDAYAPHQPYYTAPVFGYGMPAPVRRHNNFILIVALFILLIIVGISSFPKC